MRDTNKSYHKIAVVVVAIHPRKGEFNGSSRSI